MALKDLMARLESRMAVTSVTCDVTPAVTAKPSIHAGWTPVTPVTSRFSDTRAANEMEPPADPNAWRELARAYHAHHFGCPTCVAGGQGRGLRCGVGASLWGSYQHSDGGVP